MPVITSRTIVPALLALICCSSTVSGAPVLLAKRTEFPVKRGICYNDAAWSDLFGGDGSHISWQYNWDSTVSGAISGLEFIPMLWGTASDHTDQWFTNADAAIAAGSTHLLGFNEPDLAGQSDLTAQEAVDAWMTYMEPYAGQVKLGGPAISTAGLDWLEEFTNLCSDCTIDFQPVHWYDTATNYAWFTEYLTEAYALLPTDRHIWLTEFEGYGTQAEQIIFLETVMPYMDAADWIDGYSWFGVFDDNLVSEASDGDEESNALGDVYNSYYSTDVTIS